MTLRHLIPAAIAGLLAFSAPAFAGMLVRSELPAPTHRVNHGAGIVELPSGDILVCWYSGTAEANEDAVILCTQSADHGVSWSASRQVVGVGEKAIGAREVNKSVGTPILYEDAAERLWMIHGVVQRWTLPVIGNLCLNWLCSRVDAMVSPDQGRTWSAPVRLDDRRGALPRAKPLAVPGRGDLVPLYLEGRQEAGVRILDLSRVRAGEMPASRVVDIPVAGVIQPSLMLLTDGRVRAFLRDCYRQAVRTAVLDPRTMTWSRPEPTNLPNPDAAIDSFADDDGDFVLIYNPSTEDRHTLALAASRDGVHFTRGCDLVADGAQGDVAYPSVIRARDGTWHVAYSANGKTQIRHLRFDAAWLRQCLGRHG